MQAGESHSDLLHQYVHDALVTKATGSGTKLYDQLVDQIRRLKAIAQACTPQPDQMAAQQLAHLVQAVTHNVAIIDERKHEVLLTELLDVHLWRTQPSTRSSILDFVTHAVVANGALVHSCLHTLVYSFLPPPGPAQPDPSPGQRWVPSPQDATVQDSVLNATERVLQLVPTAAVRLLPLLASNLPHRLRDRSVHCLYLRALFHLAESNPGAGLREGVLAAIIDHLITVDVEIKWEDIVDVPSEEAKEEVGGLEPGDEEPDIFELEGMTELDLAVKGGLNALEHVPGGGWEGGQERRAHTENGRGGGENGGAAAAAPAAAGVPAGEVVEARPVDETADKLDSMMELTMEHIERRVAAGQLPAVWETCLAAFERTVLHTHRSKFTQFLLFFIARYAPEPCCHAFLHLLLARLMDRMQPPVTRSACASYAASFLARAAFVPEPLVVDALQRLADWCLRYTRDEDRRGGLPPIPSAGMLHSLGPQDARERHAAFFAACQALLYALCYHMEPLVLRYKRNAPPSVQATPMQHMEIENGNAHTTDDAMAMDRSDQGKIRRTHGPASSSLPDTPKERQTNQATAVAAKAAEKDAMLAACATAIQTLLRTVLPPLLAHPLDPLSSMARSVVLEFGRQTKVLGHVEVTEQVRAWERRRRSLGARHNARPLEVFFPFDPYLLQRSAHQLELSTTYVQWRRGHPTGAPRNGLHDGELHDGLSAGMLGGDSADDSSGLDASSDDDDDNDDGASTSSSSSSSESDGEKDKDRDGRLDEDDLVTATSSDSDDDDLKRTRFGSMPDSSLSSGGRRRGRLHRRLPGALKASLNHRGGSPTMLGMPIPGGAGSVSTDNGSASPWGVSPSQGYFGSFAPMSYTPGN